MPVENYWQSKMQTEKEMTTVWRRKPLRQKGEADGWVKSPRRENGFFPHMETILKILHLSYVSQYFFRSLASSSKVLPYWGSPQTIIENLFTEAKVCPWSFCHIPWPPCSPLWPCRYLQVTYCHFYSEVSYYWFYSFLVFLKQKWNIQNFTKTWKILFFSKLLFFSSRQDT